MIPFLLGNWKPIAIVGALLAAGVLGRLYLDHVYEAGVRDATQAFIEVDREGAENVRDTAEDVLRDLGSIDDPDELLRETGGLRD